MNFLNVFEERVESLFGASIQGRVMPFSFKKLAKQAARQMEAETFVVGGVDTAPALYTILVSSEDDRLMLPLYPQLTTETAQFIEGQAQAKGYVFVGQPLVRFIADPSLKSGRFSVFAENIDANALERLREEERQFLGVTGSSGGLGGAAADFQQSAAQANIATPVAPVATPANIASASAATPAAPLSNSRDAGLDALPQDVFSAGLGIDANAANAAGAAEFVGGAGMASAGAAGAGIASNAALSGIPAVNQGPATNANPQTVRAAQAAPAPSATPITCLLIDRTTGQTYTAKAPRTIIGRERNAGGILLRDPNVSRSHAELSFDGRTWRIRDLNSTNGTLVNDIDIDECILRDGDLLTFGLTNLEFREN